MYKPEMNLKEVNVKVYELRDPRDVECKPRYIGITICSLKKRLNEHINGHKRFITYKSNWIKSLLKEGTRPTIHLIEEVQGLEAACKAEKYWIKEFKEQGYRLTNLTEGGDGFKGAHLSEETKQKLSNIIISVETRQKMSKAHKGRVYSKETIEKLKNAQKGEKNYRYNRTVKRECFLVDYMNGLTCKQIGLKYKVSYHLVYNHLKSLNVKFKRKYPILNISILQYDVEGNFIKEWKTFKEISNHFQCNPKRIYSKTLFKNNSKVLGYLWKKKVPNFPIKIESYIKTNNKK